MIILDTNVVSDPIRPAPDAHVIAWLDHQVIDSLYLTTTSLSELLVGVELLPAGRRRDGLAGALGDIINRLFGPRILPFDQAAATAYAGLVRRARDAGQAISVADGQIAAIAITHGYSVATRDVAPFVAAGVDVINPWETYV